MAAHLHRCSGNNWTFQSRPNVTFFTSCRENLKLPEFVEIPKHNFASHQVDSGTVWLCGSGCCSFCESLSTASQPTGRLDSVLFTHPAQYLIFYLRLLRQCCLQLFIRRVLVRSGHIGNSSVKANRRADLQAAGLQAEVFVLSSCAAFWPRHRWREATQQASSSLLCLSPEYTWPSNTSQQIWTLTRTHRGENDAGDLFWFCFTLKPQNPSLTAVWQMKCSDPESDAALQLSEVISQLLSSRVQQNFPAIKDTVSSAPLSVPTGRFPRKRILTDRWCQLQSSDCALILECHCCPARTRSPVQHRSVSADRRSREAFRLKRASRSAQCSDEDADSRRRPRRPDSNRYHPISERNNFTKGTKL